MNKFTTGMLVGGAAAIMGVGYLMQDKKTYRKMMKKGKKMAGRERSIFCGQAYCGGKSDKGRA